MTLQRWMKEKGWRGVQLARELGVSAQAVSKWKNGTRIPRPLVMEKISRLTEGAVTIDDFYRGAAPR